MLCNACRAAAGRLYHKGTGSALVPVNVPAQPGVNAEMEVTFLSSSLRHLPVKHDMRL